MFKLYFSFTREKHTEMEQTEEGNKWKIDLVCNTVITIIMLAISIANPFGDGVQKKNQAIVHFE